MRKLNTILFVVLCLFVFSSSAVSQDSSGLSNISQIPEKYFESVSKKASHLEEKLDKKPQKVLQRLQKQEERIRKKLTKIDSFAAQNVFTGAEEKYKQLERKVQSTQKLTQYIPALDTTITTLKFLEQNQQWLGEAKEVKEKLNDAFSKVKELESKMQKAEDIKLFLKERRQYLKDRLEKFGFAKELKKLNKQVYYYSQQLNEYKAILQDPKKIERKAIDLLSKTKLFQDFMRKNSMLASLFRMPADDPNDPTYIASLAGLQTRAQVNALIQNQIAAGGPGAQQQVNQNLQAAHAQLQQLKDKVNQWGGSSDDILPEGFKPNDQKTKSFLQRFELTTNIQSQRANNIFPVTSDLGLSIGYKLNDKSVIGIGAAYKMGWGSGFNNIRITHQGMGLRSFIDWKLQGTFWLSGGYEQNYRYEIRNFDQLSNQSAWQKSGLIGLSKVVSLKSKLFKNTKLQLLWDFLSYSQIPRPNAIIFRVGYVF